MDSDYVRHLREMVAREPHRWPWRVRKIVSILLFFVMTATLLIFPTVGLSYVAFRLLPSPEWRSGPSAFLLGIIGGIGILGLPLLIAALVDRRDFIKEVRKGIPTLRLALIGRDLEWRRTTKVLAKQLDRMRNSPPPDPRREEITQLRDYYLWIASWPERAAILGIDLAQCRNALEPMAAELSMDIDKFLQAWPSESVDLSVDRSVDDSIDY
jgi:hypothetical protein